MRVAIVGSRSFPKLQLVEDFVRDLPKDTVVVSGGAKGVDITAQKCAELCGLETDIYLPDLDDCKEKLDFTKRYYARNQLIVDNSDMVVAFTEKKTGGTWDTIRRAKKASKPVTVISSLDES